MKNEGNTSGKIIRSLKNSKHPYLSGQTLSKSLGISRTAIWKHIKAIKGMGYKIEASPALGYRLNLQDLPFNEIEIASNLKTSYIGRNISFHESLGSTNETAKELAAKGAEQGFAVVADSQKKGKGRLGRRWESPAGMNIYTSVLLRPNISPVFAPQLTLVAAVAVAETVARYLNNPHTKNFGVGVKWPNDILLNSKKVAGILTEMSSEMDRINFILIGIGVNVNMAKEILPENLRTIATSLKEETGKEVSRTDFIQTLYLNLETWYKKYLKGGFAPVRKTWAGYFAMAGKTVKIQQAGKTVEGIALGIDNDGALLLREEGGNIVRIISGDVST